MQFFSKEHGFYESLLVLLLKKHWQLFIVSYDSANKQKQYKKPLHTK